MGDACCGSEPAPIESGPDEHSETPWRAPAAVIAAIAWSVGVVIEVTGGNDAAARAAFVVAIVAGGATFVPGALRSLVHGRVGVALLMTIALVGAVVLDQFGEAAALAFLFSVSEALEEWAVTRSRRGLRAVLTLVPDTARVRRGDDVVEIESTSLVVGDRIVLWAGERLPIDGVVVEGRSSVDLSAVTGESIPVEVDVDSQVLAGSINGAVSSRSSPPPRPVTARWRASCAPSRKRRTAKDAPSASLTASPDRWSQPS
jgi:cation-transporting P-type ATPase G